MLSKARPPDSTVVPRELRKLPIHHSQSIPSSVRQLFTMIQSYFNRNIRHAYFTSLQITKAFVIITQNYPESEKVLQ